MTSIKQAASVTSPTACSSVSRRPLLVKLPVDTRNPATNASLSVEVVLGGQNQAMSARRLAAMLPATGSALPSETTRRTWTP